MNTMVAQRKDDQYTASAVATSKWSRYQQDVFAFVGDGHGHAVVNAVAGSGKTTTIVEAASRLPAGMDALFLAFNKHIADELATRLPGNVKAKTLHSFGMGALYRGGTKPVLRNDKYWKLIDMAMEVRQAQARVKGKAPFAGDADLVRQTTKEVVDKARLTLTAPEELRAMCDHYAISLSPDLCELHLASFAIERGVDHYRESGLIDFTDMLYLPHRLNLQPARSDFVFVDEAQDLSAAGLLMALKACRRGGRMVFVGDERQAIQGFAGADSDSMDRIRRETGARGLPLSICYRCPSSHLDLAREIVPYIEDRPGAPVGDVRQVRADTLVDLMRPGALAVCRTNAPLVSHALKLIRSGLAARVRGRDIGRDLKQIVDAVTKGYGEEWGRFHVYLEAWARDQEELVSCRTQSVALIDRLRDQVASLYAIMEGAQAKSIDDLKSWIDDLFADESAAIWFSSVHRAKGLEADDVYILHEGKMPLRWEGQRPWQLEQEWNIRYVALTRAKSALTFVED